jgi:hypothetical protein
MGIIKWGDEDVSWQSIQSITISESYYDTHQRFYADETTGSAMPIHINLQNPRP